MADVLHTDRPRYHVVDTSGRVVGSYLNKQRARNERDKRDLAHGGATHHVQEIKPQQANAALEKLKGI